MKINSVRWGWALGGTLAAAAVEIAAAFGWVAIYSYLLHPGESAAFYQQYALRASPWVSLVAGCPIFYFACRWIGSRSPSRARPTAMGLFAIYCLLDAPITLLGDSPFLHAWFMAINYSVKFLACYLGGRIAARDQVAQPA
jgi:hypothetical protein